MLELKMKGYKEYKCAQFIEQIIHPNVPVFIFDYLRESEDTLLYDGNGQEESWSALYPDSSCLLKYSSNDKMKSLIRCYVKSLSKKEQSKIIIQMTSDNPNYDPEDDQPDDCMTVFVLIEPPVFKEELMKVCWKDIKPYDDD